MEQRIFETIETLRESINRVFIGKEDVVEDLLVCLMAGGHVLLEDVPGVGKTSLAGVLAKTTSCSFDTVYAGYAAGGCVRHIGLQYENRRVRIQGRGGDESDPAGG